MSCTIYHFCYIILLVLIVPNCIKLLCSTNKNLFDKVREWAIILGWG